MLYATTRNSEAVYSSEKAFRENRAPDGGLFVPERIPKLPQEEILAFGRETSNGAIAKIWDLFFDSPITGWDLDFSVGRNWLRLHPLLQKTILAEGWHNPDGEMAYFLRFLSERRNASWAIWAEIAAKISILGAALAKAGAEGVLKAGEKADIACISGDFSGVLAGVYLKRMGFPVGKLICCCNENNSVWELVHLGTMRTDCVSVPTCTPRADTVLPEGLEHLLLLFGGVRSGMEYAKASYIGQIFAPSEELLQKIQKEIYVSVVSDSRMGLTAAGVLQTSGQLVSPYDALCYAGVQDYRAKGGEYRVCLMLSERSPGLEVSTLSDALGITVEELKGYLWR